MGARGARGGLFREILGNYPNHPKNLGPAEMLALLLFLLRDAASSGKLFQSNFVISRGRSMFISSADAAYFEYPQPLFALQ